MFLHVGFGDVTNRSLNRPTSANLFARIYLQRSAEAFEFTCKSENLFEKTKSLYLGFKVKLRFTKGPRYFTECISPKVAKLHLGSNRRKPVVDSPNSDRPTSA